MLLCGQLRLRGGLLLRRRLPRAVAVPAALRPYLGGLERLTA